MYDQKNKTVGTVTKSNRKIVGRDILFKKNLIEEHIIFDNTFYITNNT